MRQITIDRLVGLLEAHEPPCISLYQPTHRHHPENEQDPILYRNLLTEMESSLREKYPAGQVRATLEKYQTLSRDHQFWNHRTHGLAIFSSPTNFEIFELQRPVQKLLVVADSYHVKPLIRILQSADRYQVLCLSRREARLYEGNRYALDPVELTDVTSSLSDVLNDERSESSQMVGSYGKRHKKGSAAHYHEPQTDPGEADMFRFFRSVDQGILEHHSRPSGLPLLLAALPESHEPFRRITQNPFLLAGGIMMNPDSLSLDQLCEQAWKEIEPSYLARLAELKENFNTARSRHAGSADLSDVAKAAVASQVGTLLVEADRVIPGVLDRTTGAIRPDNSANSHVDDMLDDLAELVMAKKGEVVVVPKEGMPTDTGLAAIYRY